MAKVTMPYVAGLFDGEGTVGLYRQRPTESHGVSWKRQISISLCYRPTIDDLCDSVGGTTYTDKGDRPRRRWVWTVRRKAELAILLPALIPHLREKKTQAILLWRSLSEGDHVVLEGYADTMKRLKRVEYDESL